MLPLLYLTALFSQPEQHKTASATLEQHDERQWDTGSVCLDWRRRKSSYQLSVYSIPSNCRTLTYATVDDGPPQSSTADEAPASDSDNIDPNLQYAGSQDVPGK